MVVAGGYAAFQIPGLTTGQYTPASCSAPATWTLNPPGLGSITPDGVYTAPALWPFEVANVLTAAARRGRIGAEAQAEFLERLRLLPVEIEHRPSAWLARQILPLARTYRRTACDAAYLELAIREGLPLASLDDDLRRAASAAGVALVEPA
jgi:predicted nucleic acid-binding protein